MCWRQRVIGPFRLYSFSIDRTCSQCSHCFVDEHLVAELELSDLSQRYSPVALVQPKRPPPLPSDPSTKQTEALRGVHRCSQQHSQ